MPKLTLLLGRKVLQVYDLDQPRIRIGRDEGTDVVIDNPSVSRNHAEIRREEGGWVLEDLGSSNGTFVNGERMEAGRALKAGDEVGIGKFSIVFDKVVGVGAPRAPEGPRTAAMDVEGTMHIKPHEVQEILQESSKKRRAHLLWESGGQRGTHYFSEASAVLVGQDDLCDLRVPKGPKHHLLVTRSDGGCEARNLAAFTGMKVKGQKARRARLQNGDVVEMAGVKLTFVDELA